MSLMEKMKVRLDLQNPSQWKRIPSNEQFIAWLSAALAGKYDSAEVTIRLVGEEESAQLNSQFRGKSGPTNVLSFPFEPPPAVPIMDFLGDLVICVPLVSREAQALGKAPIAHWAHLVIHGALHLLGYDHQTEAQALEMESLEARLLQSLGFPEP